MSGHEDIRGRRWSTRQRLAVLTFETPEHAAAYDASRLDLVDVVELIETCRDVIDTWDGLYESTPTRTFERMMSEQIERMRRALLDARQGATL